MFNDVVYLFIKLREKAILKCHEKNHDSKYETILHVTEQKEIFLIVLTAVKINLSQADRHLLFVC